MYVIEIKREDSGSFWSVYALLNRLYTPSPISNVITKDTIWYLYVSQLDPVALAITFPDIKVYPYIKEKSKPQRQLKGSIAPPCDRAQVGGTHILQGRPRRKRNKI